MYEVGGREREESESSAGESTQVSRLWIGPASCAPTLLMGVCCAALFFFLSLSIPPSLAPSSSDERGTISRRRGRSPCCSAGLAIYLEINAVSPCSPWYVYRLSSKKINSARLGSEKCTSTRRSITPVHQQKHQRWVGWADRGALLLLLLLQMDRAPPCSAHHHVELST